MRRLTHKIMALAALLTIGGAQAQAQQYYFFDEGTITPEDGATVAQISEIVIDYTNVKGTGEGLNPAVGVGTGWLTSDNGSYNVRFTDDYTNHRLTFRVEGNPIVKGGDYKLSIPEGKFNVYGNPDLLNEGFSLHYTVDGSLDMGDAAQVQLLSSYPADGDVVELPLTQLSLTFDQDVTVNHSVFNAAGLITNLTSGGYIQLNMEAEGNVVTITRGTYSSSDFMPGQSYVLEIYADRIKSAQNPAVTLPATSITFKVAAADEEGIYVMAQIPAAGENIHNAGSVTFNRNLSSVDASKVRLLNENGHEVELSSVGRDGQSPRSLIFNIAEGTHLQGNTTYKLHLEAGAVTSGQYTNDEMDAAYWCIPQETFPLQWNMDGETFTAFDSISLTIDMTGIRLADGFSTDGIRVTGVGENQQHVYSQSREIRMEEATESTLVSILFLDRITPAMLEAGGAIYNSVKVVVPEGCFTDNEGRLNRHQEYIVYVIEDKPMGEAVWTFNPASGSQLDYLGLGYYAEEEDGTRMKYYRIDFSVSGENVYARIPDGSKLYIRNAADLSLVREFSRYDVMGYNNQFSLELGPEAIRQDGIYELVIPADAINLYSDAGQRTRPQHPDLDVIARWTVGDPGQGIESIAADAATPAVTYDLLGRRTSSAHSLRIVNGKVIK